MRTTIGVIKGDTRSLDYSSYGVICGVMIVYVGSFCVIWVHIGLHRTIQDFVGLCSKL